MLVIAVAGIFVGRTSWPVMFGDEQLINCIIDQLALGIASNWFGDRDRTGIGRGRFDVGLVAEGGGGYLDVCCLRIRMRPQETFGGGLRLAPLLASEMVVFFDGGSIDFLWELEPENSRGPSCSLSVAAPALGSFVIVAGRGSQ
jgi:hypothetical protein